MTHRWVILTGEYPPQPGGVSDYTRQVARALARAGDEVHVFSSALDGESDLLDEGVSVRRLPDRFGRAGLGMLDAALKKLSRPYRLLVQYVPHAFGCKAMNVPFCLWLGTRRRDEIWVMFHEVQFPFSALQPLRLNVLAGVTHMMAWLLVRAADRIFISIPSWEILLRPMRSAETRLSPMTWIPIPSNIPDVADARRSHELRSAWTNGANRQIIGHFGTFGPSIQPLLTAVMSRVLYKGNRVGILIGRGSGQCAATISRDHPQLRNRIFASGELPGSDLAAHLAACDLLIQPYPDAASARRSSLMAALALGIPVATNSGPRTESIWEQSNAVGLCRAWEDQANGPLKATIEKGADAMIELAESLLADAPRRRQISLAATSLYKNRFAIEHTITAIRQAAAQSDSRARMRGVVA